jgi:hypothetical protein
MQTRREGSKMFKAPKENLNLEFCIHMKLSLKSEGEIKISSKEN